MITFFRGAVFYCEDFASSTLWFSSDLGVESNHSHLVTSAWTFYRPSAPLVPKESEVPISAPRLKDRKIRPHALHPQPFSVLHLPVPNGRHALIPMVLALYFFRLTLPLDNMSAEGWFFFVASTVAELPSSHCWRLTALVMETNAKWPRARFDPFLP
jgi:hypothetical protein